MSRLTTWIDRILRRTNLESTIATTIADDGSASAVSPGDPTPMRSDPSTGALLTSAVAGPAAPVTVPSDENENVSAPFVAARAQGLNGAGQWENVRSYVALPTSGDRGLGFYLIGAPTLTTEPGATFAASAPHAGADTPDGQNVYLAGYDRADVGTETPLWALPTLSHQAGDWSVANATDRPLFVRGTDDADVAERLATHAQQETQTARLAAIEAAVESIDGKTPELDGGRVPIAAASLPLPADAAQEHVLATSPHAARLSADGVGFVSEIRPLVVSNPSVDGFGHEVSVSPSPVIQAHFTNGAPPDTWSHYTSSTGTATSAATGTSLASVAVGANGASTAELTTLTKFTYRSGEGLRLMFTAAFTAPAVGGLQAIGVGPHDGYAVGYQGTAFGFLRRSGGRTEFRTLTVTTASTTAESVTVTLDGSPKLVAVTNSGNAATTAREIAAADYSTTGTGWDAYQTGSTVLFVARRAGPRAGAFTLAGTTAVGLFAQTLAGLAPTDTWEAQTAWNGDRLDGSLGQNNPSGATLDPTKLSVWRVLIPYLGAGNTVLQWLDPATNRWTTCHTIRFANSSASPSLRNPTVGLWMHASGAANVGVSSASMALFVDGRVEPTGPRIAVRSVVKNNVGNASETPVFTVRTDRIYNGAENRCGIRPLTLTASANSTGEMQLFFYRGATLTGANFAAAHPIAPISLDSSATAATGGVLVGVLVTARSGGGTPIVLSELGFDLEPGDALTVTAQQTTGVNGTVCVGLSGYHDNGNGTGL
jgi:hypothetical protein